MPEPLPPTSSSLNLGPQPPGLGDILKSMLPQQQVAPPDPYALSDAECVQLLADTRSYCEPGRELFEYGWWRNLLYLLERQWIYWNPSSRQWNDKRLAKWVPKPVTNIVRTTMVSIAAILSDIKLAAIGRPNGGSPTAVLAAETVDDLEPSIKAEHGMDTVMDEADFWVLITGNVFLHPHWDPTSKDNTVSVPLEECLTCHAELGPDQIQQNGSRCPECGGSSFQPAVNADGEPKTQAMPIGKGRTLAASPLEVLCPLYAQKFEQVDRLIYLTWTPAHQIEDECGKDFASKLALDQGPSTRSLQLYKALATTSDYTPTPSAINTGAFQGNVKGSTEQHLWIKPCKQFPQGFYMRFFGEGSPVPFRGDPDPTTGQPKPPKLPYKKVDGTPIWPWIHYHDEKIGGRLYAQSAVDSIIQKQNQLNQIDSLTLMTIQRMGNPIWLEPKGAEVERLTGEPGLVVKWQPTGANGAEPKRVPGENPPQSFFVVREQYKNDAEELAGTYDVVKGSKPAGVDSFAGLNLLVERSQSRFSKLFKQRGEAYREWYQMAVELERAYGPTARVKAVLGPNRSWTFQTFQKTDLTGDISIIVEDGTNLPKTALGRRAAIEHAKQAGVLMPATSPEQQYALLNEFGLTQLLPSLDSDVKSCLREQQAFEDWATGGMQGPPPLHRMPWDSDAVHLIENRKWMNGDRVQEILRGAKDVNAIVTILAQHLQEHATAMMGSLPSPSGPSPNSTGASAGSSNGKPPGGPGVGAGRALTDSNTQAGTPQTTPPGQMGAAS